jgi:hypothetical protein
MMSLKMAPFAAAFRLRQRVGTFLPPPSSANADEEGEGEDGAVILNCLVAAEKGARISVGKDAVLEHCLLTGPGRVEVSAGALVSGLAFAGRGALKGR